METYIGKDGDFTGNLKPSFSQYLGKGLIRTTTSQVRAIQQQNFPLLRVDLYRARVDTCSFFCSKNSHDGKVKTFWNVGFNECLGESHVSPLYGLTVIGNYAKGSPDVLICMQSSNPCMLSPSALMCFQYYRRQTTKTVVILMLMMCHKSFKFLAHFKLQLCSCNTKEPVQLHMCLCERKS